MIDPKKIATLLGNQVKFIPARTDHVHTILKDKQYNVADLENWFRNNDSYTNAVIAPMSAPKGKCFVLIDQDDHKGTGKLDDLSSLGLPKTWTVQTKSGVGTHKLFLMDMEKAKSFGKDKFVLDSFPNTEFFVFSYDNGRRIVAPGSSMADGSYDLLHELPLAELPKNVIDTFSVQARTDASEIDKKLAHRANHWKEGNEDTHENKIGFNSWLNKLVEPFVIGAQSAMTDGDGRDNFIYQAMMEGATYSLSTETIFQMVSGRVVNNTDVMLESPCDEEQIYKKAENAYNNIKERYRNQERAVSKDLKPFEEDEFGVRIVARESLEKKVKFLSQHQLGKILSSPSLLITFCESVVYDQMSGQYYVGKMTAASQYRKRYEREIVNKEKYNQQINHDELLRLKADTVLHWQRMTPKHFNETYKVFINTTLKNLSVTRTFKEHSFICNAYPRNVEDEIVIDEDGNFFPYTKSPIEPAKDATKKELIIVKELINTHLKRIVDPNNFEEESSWILDRYAILLQNPHAKIDNIMVMQGPQGSGKTSLIQFMHLLFPRNDTTIFNDIEDAINRFVEHTRLSHFDDINPNSDDKVINILKAKSTSSTKSREQKYVDREILSGTINYSISTNEEITNPEILRGRRFTCFINRAMFLREDIASEVEKLSTLFMADDWRLFRVFHTFMLKRKVKDFRSDYKTEEQKMAIMESNKGSDFAVGLANMIANYGYIDNNTPIIIPGETCNRFDFQVMLGQHYFTFDSDVENLRPVHGMKTISMFQNDKKNVYPYFRSMFLDDGKKFKTNINKSILSTYGWKVPNMRDWIKLLTVTLMDSVEKGMIQHVVKTFKFEEQWKWDNKTKPDVENLGNINIYDSLDLINLHDDEDF